MEFEQLFLTGWALHLDDLGLGVWKPNSAYLEDETAITHTAVPAFPDRLVTLSAYSVTDDPSLSNSTLGLQIRTRGAAASPTNATDISGPIYDALHGAHDFRLPSPIPGDEDTDPVPGVWVVQCLRRSSVSGGQDENDRWSYVQNFYADVHRPSTHRQ